MSELKIIRVFAQGESSTMQKAYDVAKYQVKFQYSSLFIVEYEERSITDIVNLNLSETDHIKWLLEKDGCIINCHPFQADFPPVWNYNYFLSKLKEEATAKGIRMFPNPDLVDVDPTFSQVILRIFHRRIDLVSSFILLLNSNIRISLATLNLYNQFVFRV